MKLAITGANGFVGNALVKYFSQEHEVIAFQRQMQQQAGNISYEKWDITESYEDTISCDVCIHAAADTGYQKSRSFMYEQNVATCKNIIDYVVRSGCKHLFYISSSSVYQGISWIIDETISIDEKNLRNSYSFTKYQAEKYFQAHIPQGIKLTILRPRAIYGEGDRILEPTILQYQICKRLLLLWNGNTRTSLTNIHFFISAIDGVIKKQKTSFEIFNITDVQTKTYNQIYDELIIKYQLKGKIHIPLIFFKIMYFLNPNKISYLLDSFGNDKILNTQKFENFTKR